MMKLTAVILVAVWVALTPTRATADDSSRGVVLPGWRSEPAGSIEVLSSSVALSGGGVEVALRLRKDVPGPVRMVIATPRFGLISYGEPYPSRQFEDLSAAVNDHVIGLNDEVRALMGHVDITSLLRRENVDPFLVSHVPPMLPSSTPSAVVENLRRADVVEWMGDDQYSARWRVERIVSLMVDEDREKLTFKYKPMPAFTLVPSSIDTPGFNATLYCSNEAELEKEVSQPSTGVTLSIWEFAIPVSVDGYAPTTTILTVGPPGEYERKRLLTVVCGPDGHAIFERGLLPGTVVQTGEDGMVHVLTISMMFP